MDKFTIGIPTIWKSERINRLVKELNNSDKIGEILIIDNLHLYDDRFNGLSKVRIIQPEENLYVNPAWNRIVEEAQWNSIALLNDDINFDISIFDRFTDEGLLQTGIIGQAQSNYTETVFTGEPIIEDATRTSDWGWGCFIIFHKEHWRPIPSEIKIWYGDTWIKKRSPIQKWRLVGLPIETEMSSTSDLEEVRAIRDRDGIIWGTM
jgi:hypothetical protein